MWVRETTQAPQQVFVGRDAEMAMLRTKLVSTLDGTGGLVLIGGEPGVGKTTLVRQLIREAEQRGRARCSVAATSRRARFRTRRSWR